MHFEFLVEDRSGTLALEFFVKEILGPNGDRHSFRFHSYKGVGRIPKSLGAAQAKKRMLLENLPRLLRGYGKSLRTMGANAAVVVVVDLDRRDCVAFKQELLDLLGDCHPAPQTLFRIAIEEMEAWLLGDRQAILKAYPRAKEKVLNKYRQDAICGTWEMMADAIHPGGSKSLKKEGWPASLKNPT